MIFFFITLHTEGSRNSTFVVFIPGAESAPSAFWLSGRMIWNLFLHFIECHQRFHISYWNGKDLSSCKDNSSPIPFLLSILSGRFLPIIAGWQHLSGQCDGEEKVLVTSLISLFPYVRVQGYECVIWLTLMFCLYFSKRGEFQGWHLKKGMVWELYWEELGFETCLRTSIPLHLNWLIK